MSIPAHGTAPAAAAVAPTAPVQPTPTPATASPTPEKTIQFQCSSCSKSFRVSAKAAGKVAKCGCGGQTRVPKQHSIPSPQPTAAPMPAIPGQPSVPTDHAIAPAGAFPDPFAPSAASPPVHQVSQPTEADPLGLGSIQQYGTDLTPQQTHAMAPHLQPKTRPKAKTLAKPVSKKEKEAGIKRLLGLGQIILGLLIVLAAGGLVYAAMNADRVKGRSIKGIIILAVVGCGLMGSGATALFNTD